jgi:hypothetical protein
MYLYLGNELLGNDEVERLVSLKTNRSKVIALMAYSHAILEATRNFSSLNGGSNEVYAVTSVNVEVMSLGVGFESYVEMEKVDDKPLDNHAAVQLFKIMEEVAITKVNLLYAIKEYNDKVTSTQNYIDNTRTKKENGLEKLFSENPKPDRELILTQLKELQEQIGNGLTARTYGFEIEVPDAKGVDAPKGFEKGEDGSLRSYEGSSDCDCDCSDCCYHSCDCDWCEQQNEDPEHCGNSSCNDCDSAEFRTVGGVQRMKHHGMYHLCQQLNAESAEINDSAGTHIHVFAADLTTHQVGQVIAAYKWLEKVLAPIAGRRGTSYAMDIPVQYVGNALKKKTPMLTCDKPRAVNLSNLFNARGTIEFRQMDCNLDSDRITAWAWIVRGMVTAAKRGATLAQYKQVQDLNDVVKVLAGFNVEPKNEHPELIVYGSKSDDDKIVRVQHRNTANAR